MIFFESPNPSWGHKAFRQRTRALSEVYDRQEKIPGYDTEALRRTTVLGIGAGGLGSFVYPALVRKGVQFLRICDDDVVEPSNLNRQAFFPDDLYRPKAICLARHVSRHSLLGCEVSGHRVDFGLNSADTLASKIEIAFVGVDNDQTRAFASRFFRQRQIPVIFAAVNENADYGYVFVQRPDQACLGCVFPEAMRIAESEPRRCTAAPAVVDILQAVGALALYAIDSLLMPGRHCRWTFRSVNLAGGTELHSTATRLATCPLCGPSH